MTKAQQLTDVAQELTAAQVDGLLAFARYLRSASEFEVASPEALASIDRGLADAAAGRVRPLTTVLAAIDAKLTASEG